MLRRSPTTTARCRIVLSKRVLNGTDSDIAAAIRGLGSDNNGINRRNRRNQEAAIFGVHLMAMQPRKRSTKWNVRPLFEAEEKITEERAARGDHKGAGRPRLRKRDAATEDGKGEREGFIEGRSVPCVNRTRPSPGH